MSEQFEGGQWCCCYSIKITHLYLCEHQYDLRCGCNNHGDDDDEMTAIVFE